MKSFRFSHILLCFVFISIAFQYSTELNVHADVCDKDWRVQVRTVKNAVEPSVEIKICPLYGPVSACKMLGGKPVYTLAELSQEENSQYWSAIRVVTIDALGIGVIAPIIGYFMVGTAISLLASGISWLGATTLGGVVSSAAAPIGIASGVITGTTAVQASETFAKVSNPKRYYLRSKIISQQKLSTSSICVPPGHIHSSYSTVIDYASNLDLVLRGLSAVPPHKQSDAMVKEIETQKNISTQTLSKRATAVQ